MKIQNGGMIIKNKNPEQSLNFFIENSTEINLLGKTESSILFVCKLANGVDSPYEMFRAEDYKSPVNYILLKLCFLNTSRLQLNNTQLSVVNHFIKSDIRAYNEEYNYRIHDYRIVGNSDTFAKEINVQTDVFLKTIAYVDPICPAPIYGDVKNKDLSIAFIEKLQGINASFITQEQFGEILVLLKDIFSSFHTNYPDYELGLGILAMEFAQDYCELHSLYNDVHKSKVSVSNLRIYETMARLQLIELALKTGYSQCDFHYSNFMVNKTAVGYYKDIPGRVLIIDLGYAEKIPLDKLREIRDAYENKDYMNCLQILYGLGRIQGEVVNTLMAYPHLYAWAPHLYDNLSKKAITNTPETLQDLNDEIDAMKRAKELATDNRVTKFNKLHDDDPSYPLLPLSNNIKNSLFPGMTGGKKKRKRRTFKKRKGTFNKMKKTARI